jgi:hypothetical protein
VRQRWSSSAARIFSSTYPLEVEERPNTALLSSFFACLPVHGAYFATSRALCMGRSTSPSPAVPLLRQNKNEEQRSDFPCRPSPIGTFGCSQLPAAPQFGRTGPMSRLEMALLLPSGRSNAATAQEPALRQARPQSRPRLSLDRRAMSPQRLRAVPAMQIRSLPGIAHRVARAGPYPSMTYDLYGSKSPESGPYVNPGPPT